MKLSKLDTKIYKQLPQTLKQRVKELAALKLDRKADTVGDYYNGIRSIPRIDTLNSEEVEKILIETLTQVSAQYQIELNKDITEKKKAYKTFSKYVLQNGFLNSKL